MGLAQVGLTFVDWLEYVILDDGWMRPTSSRQGNHLILPEKNVIGVLATLKSKCIASFVVISQ